MTPDHEPFLRAVCAAPDDDLPRLVYADWLDDRGDPRGEFIRLQIRIAADIPERHRWPLHPLYQRMNDLHTDRGAAWEGDLGNYVAEWKYARGFIDEVRLSGAAFVARGVELFERFPVYDVTLTDIWEDAEAIGKSPQLKHIRSLSVIQDGLSNEEATAVLGSRHFRRLETLCLMQNRFDHEAVSVLAASPGMATLRHLTFYGENVGSEGVVALAHSPVLNDLWWLTLDRCRVGPAGVEALTARTGLPSLKRLVLGAEHVGGRGERALAQRAIRGLEKLSLPGLNASDWWTERIAAQYPPGVVEF